MTWQKRDSRRNGFTLVELLVVIVILSVLTAIGAPKLIDQIDKSKWDLTKPGMKTIETAIDSYILNCRQLPSNLNDLVANPGISGWTGPYLKKNQINDPWGFEYGYFQNGTVNPGGYDLVSYGKDGILGGEGYNAEQYND